MILPNESACPGSTVRAALRKPSKADRRRQLVEAFADAAIAAGVMAAPQSGESKQLAFASWVTSVAGDAGLRRPRPVKRVAVDLDRRAVSLDGTAFDVPSEQALRWVKALADSPGCWIASRDLWRTDKELYGTRSDKLRQYLPPEIAGLIESAPGVGSRLLLQKTDAEIPQHFRGQCPN
jgi:hypothetical protein